MESVTSSSDVMTLPDSPLYERLYPEAVSSSVRRALRDPYVLLGRDRFLIDPDVSYLAGRRVLVTGAGGSIGSALCRRLDTLEIGELAFLDRDESALHTLMLKIYGNGMLDSPETVLGDIRDYGWMTQLMRMYRPDVVFHAAALKHLPMLERFPHEAVKTNVMGTANVLQAAQTAGVGLLVNVSTDKAVDPTCVLGTSKRLAERIVARYRTRCVSVRFGNVLDSRGSVLCAFRSQLEAGLPLSITDTRMVRHFMTAEEAVDLLLYAGAIGQSGEIIGVDMGDPIRIVDLAERLISKSGLDAGIVVTGCRMAEKLQESQHNERDQDWRQIDGSRIWRATVSPLALGALARLDTPDPLQLKRNLTTLCEES